MSKIKLEERKQSLFVNIRHCHEDFIHYISLFESSNVKFVTDANLDR